MSYVISRNHSSNYDWGPLWPLLQALPSISEDLDSIRYTYDRQDDGRTVVLDWVFGSWFASSFIDWYQSHGADDSSWQFLAALDLLLRVTLDPASSTDIDKDLTKVVDCLTDELAEGIYSAELVFDPKIVHAFPDVFATVGGASIGGLAA